HTTRQSRCSYVIFSSTLPRPPTSPLFPYTTLFRSASAAAGVHEAQDLNITAAAELVAQRLAVEPGADSVEQGLVSFRVTTQQGTDRKSTRLNSSHVKISYAVFCLKKKKRRT